MGLGGPEAFVKLGYDSHSCPKQQTSDSQAKFSTAVLGSELVYGVVSQTWLEAVDEELEYNIRKIRTIIIIHGYHKCNPDCRTS